MRVGIEKLTKRVWYAAGGFRNPALFRRATRSGAWQYFRDTTRAGQSGGNSFIVNRS